jgi:hypothetical protein
MNANKQSHSRKPSKRKAAASLNDPPLEWQNLTAKKNAYLTIMRNIIKDPDLGKAYLESDEDAAQAFRDEGLVVPGDIKVVFLPAGDTKKMPLGAGSAIIELPPRTGSELTDKQLLELFVCTYHIAW